ncbi:MAG: hypothetical protein ACSHX7_14890, partial [Luteolibacter sp.]
STLFLLDRTQREATAGRRFERLIPSVPLWMQILAILLLAYFLAEPRFQKENSVQRVAVVLDSSASMTVFREEAIAAISKKLPTLQGSATSLELTLLPATPGADRLYTGSSTEELISTLESYTPTGGVIDPSYALRLARSIVSNEGTVIYLTDTPAETLPYDSTLISVGKPTGNIGFTGISFEENQGALTWQAIIRNYGDTPQTRSWSLQSSTGSSEPKSFDIAPGAFISIQAAFPENAKNVRLQLTPDDFTLDDTLPIVAPAPKSLGIFTATSPAFQDLTEKLIRSLAATRPSADAATSDLVITSYDPLDPALPQTNAILFVEDPTSSGKYLKGGILAEASPLMDGVNWQSLLVRETLQLPRSPSDRVLLWQEKRPLIFLRQLGDQQILCFNFDLRLSNATQQPAFVVLLHRFAESIRTRKVAPQTLNLETSQPIRIATAPEGKITVQATTPTGETLETPTANTAPPTPGFLNVSQSDHPLLTAAIHFADIREADLSACGTATTEATTTQSALRQHTAPDPLSRLWLLVILAALLIAWHFTQTKNNQTYSR